MLVLIDAIGFSLDIGVPAVVAAVVLPAGHSHFQRGRRKAHRPWSQRWYETTPTCTTEFISEVAAPFPVPPEHDQPCIFGWSNAFIGFGVPQVAGEFDDYVTATKNLGEYGRSLAESRRTSQREDCTTIFVTAEVDGDQLTSEEIASFLPLLVVAGQ